MGLRTTGLAVWLVGLGGLAGCGPVRVGGQIDGEGIGGARDAIWDTLSVEFGPFSYELTTIVLTDFPDACGTYGAFLEAARSEFGCDDVCEEYLGLAEERGLSHDAYWSTVLAVNTSEGQVGTFDLDAELGEGEFDVSFNDYDAVPLHDPGACEAACEAGELLVPEAEAGQDGELELEVDEDLLLGRFTVSFGGDDGLDGRFVAEPCDMGDWFFDF
jgi:hypothetical protein